MNWLDYRESEVDFRKDQEMAKRTIISSIFSRLGLSPNRRKRPSAGFAVVLDTGKIASIHSQADQAAWDALDRSDSDTAVLVNLENGEWAAHRYGYDTYCCDGYYHCD